MHIMLLRPPPDLEKRPNVVAAQAIFFEINENISFTIFIFVVTLFDHPRFSLSKTL